MAQDTTQSATTPKAFTHSAPVDDRLISDKEVAHLLGTCRAWPWKLVQRGKFPQPIRLPPRFTRWRLSDVRAWMADPAAWQAANTEA